MRFSVDRIRSKEGEAIKSLKREAGTEESSTLRTKLGERAPSTATDPGTSFSFVRARISSCSAVFFT
ncbi:Uncharacterised protein [Chlamydia trachomatis]|nr:Uncharacterised protein [Chlamydia trachomatis]